MTWVLSGSEIMLRLLCQQSKEVDIKGVNSQTLSLGVCPYTKKTLYQEDTSILSRFKASFKCTIEYNFYW